MKLYQSVLLSSTVLTLAACAPAVEQVDLEAEREAASAVNVRWLELARAKDAAGIAALFVENGTLFGENFEPAVGRSAIEAQLAQNMAANPDAIANFAGDRIEMAASGDRAVEYGSWSDTDSNGVETDHGKYMTILRKVNGTWMVEADMAIGTKPDGSS